jgi:hypothetical protein
MVRAERYVGSHCDLSRQLEAFRDALEVLDTG